MTQIPLLRQWDMAFLIHIWGGFGVHVGTYLAAVVLYMESLGLHNLNKSGFETCSSAVRAAPCSTVCVVFKRSAPGPTRPELWGNCGPVRLVRLLSIVWYICGQSDPGGLLRVGS